MQTNKADVLIGGGEEMGMTDKQFEAFATALWRTVELSKDEKEIRENIKQILSSIVPVTIFDKKD